MNSPVSSATGLMAYRRGIVAFSSFGQMPLRLFDLQRRVSQSIGFLSHRYGHPRGRFPVPTGLTRLMKTRKLQAGSPQPRKVQRADLAPFTGFAIVVDGHFKTEFVEGKAAKKAATELLAK